MLSCISFSSIRTNPEFRDSVRSLFTETPGVRSHSAGHLGTVSMWLSSTHVSPLTSQVQASNINTWRFYISSLRYHLQYVACLLLSSPNLPLITFCIALSLIFNPLSAPMLTHKLLSAPGLSVSVKLTLLPIISERLFHFDVGNLTRVP